MPGSSSPASAFQLLLGDHNCALWSTSLRQFDCCRIGGIQSTVKVNGLPEPSAAEIMVNVLEIERIRKMFHVKHHDLRFEIVDLNDMERECFTICNQKSENGYGTSSASVEGWSHTPLREYPSPKTLKPQRKTDNRI
jgi:hypothetical protein